MPAMSKVVPIAEASPGADSSAPDAEKGNGPAPAPRASVVARRQSALKASQVELATNKNTKRATIAVLLSFTFFDVLGTVLFMPAGPILCANAEGGPTDSQADLLMVRPGDLDLKAMGMPKIFLEVYDSLNAEKAAKDLLNQPSELGDAQAAYLSGNKEKVKDIIKKRVAHPKAFPELPAKFSTSNNLLMLLSSLCSGIGSFIWGTASDKLGRKPILIVCGLGGLTSYVIMYLAGEHWNNFYAYLAGLCLNGLFSAAMQVVTCYILDTTPAEEATPVTSGVMAMGLVGGAVGAFVLMPFLSGRAENLFNSAFIGIAGTVVCLLGIIFVVTEPAKKVAEEQSVGKDGLQTSPSEKKITKTLTRMLWIAVVAGALDSAGDEGTRIARGTISLNTWTVLADVNTQNNLLLGLIVLVIIAMVLCGIGKSLVGLGATATFGAFCTFLTQLLLNYKIIQWENPEGYLGVWYCGKLFGFLSTFGGNFIVNEKAPEEERGSWTGRFALGSEGAGACATLAISLLYDSFNTAPSLEDVLDGKRNELG